MDIPEDVLDLIKLREGFSSKVYRDTRGVLTAGWGHKLLPSEIAQYPVGSEVPEAQLDSWLNNDIAGAYKAAQSQAMQLGEPTLLPVLTSTNFQLGIHWTAEFAQTWQLLLSHDWQAAINHLQASAWHKQTPVRVEDFVQALQVLCTTKTSSIS